MHVRTRVRPDRLVRVLALAGGLFWIVKVLLIWENGGTNTTEGTVGLLFLIGTVLVASATVVWTWRATRGRSLLMRAGLPLGALFLLLFAINLPIPLVRAVLPGSWLADEFGVILVAVAAMIAASGVIGSGTITNRA